MPPPPWQGRTRARGPAPGLGGEPGPAAVRQQPRADAAGGQPGARDAPLPRRGGPRRQGRGQRGVRRSRERRGLRRAAAVGLALRDGDCGTAVDHGCRDSHGRRRPVAALLARPRARHVRPRARAGGPRAARAGAAALAAAAPFPAGDGSAGDVHGGAYPARSAGPRGRPREPGVPGLVGAGVRAAPEGRSPAERRRAVRLVDPRDPGADHRQRRREGAHGVSRAAAGRRGRRGAGRLRVRPPPHRQQRTAAATRHRDHRRCRDDRVPAAGRGVLPRLEGRAADPGHPERSPRCCRCRSPTW